jgi:hypothetical protein
LIDKQRIEDHDDGRGKHKQNAPGER